MNKRENRKVWSLESLDWKSDEISFVRMLLSLQCRNIERKKAKLFGVNSLDTVTVTWAGAKGLY